jgi:hypothetical protein
MTTQQHHHHRGGNNNSNTRRQQTIDNNDVESALRDKIMKDLSLRVNSIPKEEERKLMERYILQTLTETTLLRLGGGNKAIFELNKGLIHVLELIKKAPGGMISTRELLRTINSTTMHKYLKEAELSGFIKREMVKVPEGKKGGTMIVNSLTEEGRVLLDLADEYFGSRRNP